MVIVISKDELNQLVSNSISLSECLHALNLTLSGNNFIQLKKKLTEYAISTSHFLGKKHNKNIANLKSNKTSLDKILVENSTYQTSKLSKRLQQENIIPYQCNLCGLTNEWNNRQLSLHLDHINGINDDHRLENLRFICPNCHSQTPTYCGRNKTGNKKSLKKPKATCPKCQGAMADKRSKQCRKCMVLREGLEPSRS